MTAIRTTRDPFKFYLTLSIQMIVCLGMGILFLFISFQENLKGIGASFSPLLFVFGACIILYAAYCVYGYFKTVPVVVVDKEGILFNKENFNWTELDVIEFTGKKPFKVFGISSQEAATLKFNDGREKYFYDDMYSNGWQVKLFLQQVVIEHKAEVAIPDPADDDAVETGQEYFDTYRGNQFLSMRGMLLWSFIIFFIVMTLSDPQKLTRGSLLFIFLFAISWFFLCSSTMNYFMVSDHFLLVKNHNFIWKKRVYRIAGIKEIVFEERGRAPNRLRIITNDFRNKCYPAGTLNERDWLALKDRLEGLGIKVRNELTMIFS